MASNIPAFPTETLDACGDAKVLAEVETICMLKSHCHCKLVVANMAVRPHRRLDAAQELEELITSDVECDMVGRGVKP